MGCPFHRHCADCVAAGASVGDLLEPRRCATCPSSEVAVSGHGLARALDRAPELGLATGVKASIRDALHAGRAGAKPPLWLERREHGSIYAWTADESIVFVLRRDGSGQLVLISVLTPVRAAA
jgi:hypothetical protein